METYTSEDFLADLKKRRDFLFRTGRLYPAKFDDNGSLCLDAGEELACDAANQEIELQEYHVQYAENVISYEAFGDPTFDPDGSEMTNFRSDLLEARDLIFSKVSADQSDDVQRMWIDQIRDVVSDEEIDLVARRGAVNLLAWERRSNVLHSEECVVSFPPRVIPKLIKLRHSRLKIPWMCGSPLIPRVFCSESSVIRKKAKCLILVHNTYAETGRVCVTLDFHPALTEASYELLTKGMNPYAEHDLITVCCDGCPRKQRIKIRLKDVPLLCGMIRDKRFANDSDVILQNKTRFLLSMPWTYQSMKKSELFHRERLTMDEVRSWIYQAFVKRD